MLKVYKEEAKQYIDAHAKIFTDVSDQIWANPELSLKEFSSAALYKKVLKENGFRVEENLSGIETAFSGSFGKAAVFCHKNTGDRHTYRNAAHQMISSAFPIRMLFPNLSV